MGKIHLQGKKITCMGRIHLQGRDSLAREGFTCKGRIHLQGEALTKEKQSFAKKGFVSKGRTRFQGRIPFQRKEGLVHKGRTGVQRKDLFAREGFVNLTFILLPLPNKPGFCKRTSYQSCFNIIGFV